MNFYEGLQKVASQVLTNFDQGGIKLIHLTMPTTGTPDEPGTPTEMTYDVKGVVSGVEFKYTQDSFTATAEKTITVAIRNDITPSINDFFEVDGVRYKIIKDISVPVAGTRCVWKFLVSKGG